MRGGQGFSAGSNGPVLSGEEPAENPNLLLWTEQFQQEVWVKTNSSVVADVDETADNVDSTGALASVRQVSTTAATVGVAVSAAASFTGSYARFSVVGSFDGLDYCFSVYLRDASGGDGNLLVLLVIDRSGGFLRASIEDAVGIENYLVKNAQLEQASSPSTYQIREGT